MMNSDQYGYEITSVAGLSDLPSSDVPFTQPVTLVNSLPKIDFKNLLIVDANSA